MRIDLAIICSIFVLVPAGSSALLAQENPVPIAEQTNTIIDQLADGDALENMFCPVMPEEEVDPNFFSMYQGRQVYLCCKRCRTKFEADPEAYIANLPPLAVTTLLLSDNQDEAQTHYDGHDHLEEPDASQVVSVEHHDDGHAHTEPQNAASAVADNEGEHDHSAHAKESSGLTRALSYLGRFHVLVTHFPIGLLTFGALFELAAMLGIGGSNSNKALGVVRASISIGAIAAVASAGLGLMNAIGASYSGVLSEVFWWHRLLGLVTAGLAIITWIAVERRARKSTPSTVARARAAILVTAAFVGITGHLGGSLVFGWEYLIP